MAGTASGKRPARRVAGSFPRGKRLLLRGRQGSRDDEAESLGHGAGEPRVEPERKGVLGPSPAQAEGEPWTLAAIPPGERPLEPGQKARCQGGMGPVLPKSCPGNPVSWARS